MRIGIAGTGRMGRAMAERLLEGGDEVVVWNRTPEKAAPLLQAGASQAETPAALVSQAEAIITVLTDAAALEAVYGGAAGLLAADCAGKLFIEMSTVRPETQVALAERVRSAGGQYVECAVSGSVGPARQGKLVGLAGGEAEDIADARPVLEKLCRRLEHVGPVGAGASVKLAVNLPLVLYFQALGEAYSLCRHLGRDPAWLIELMSDTSGGPNLLKARGPAIAEALGGGDPAAAFGVDAIIKDMRTMLEEAEGRSLTLPLTEAALRIYEEAGRAGWAGRDGATLAAYWPSRGVSESG
jgi:3-hydroxyisobutyrate dehydrogenase